MPDRRGSLEERVVRVAEAALAERGVVSPIDVLTGLGWLTLQAVDTWRQGRVDDLERLAQVNPHKLSSAWRQCETTPWRGFRSDLENRSATGIVSPASEMGPP